MSSKWIFLGMVSTLITLSSSKTAAQEYWISGPPYIETCSGTFHDNGGPSGNYNSTDYTQTFTSDNGGRLQFDFTYWQVFAFADLTIHDGPSTAFPIIGTFDFNSGSPGVIVSSDTSLTFVWDGLNSGGGWDATISCLPPIPKVIMGVGTSDTLCSGFFYDSGEANTNYANNEYFVNTICPQTTSDYLRISFPNDFSLGAGDSLFVYNGSDINATLLSVYTGENQYEEINSQVPGGCLTFEFKSDGTGTSTGWQGEISCSTQPLDVQFVLGEGIRYNACGAKFYDDGGPAFNYGTNIDRQLTFVSEDGCGVGLDFTSWEVFTIDELTIYDGEDMSAPILGSYSFLNNGTPGVINASGSAITIHFTTNNNVNGAGWSGEVTCPNKIFPTISFTQGSSIGCSGDSITLEAPPSSQYLWNTGETSQSIDVQQSGSYYVTVSGAQGCVENSDTIDVVVYPLPAAPVITPDGPLNFCDGEDVNLSASAALDYLWNTGATSQDIDIQQSGSYFVTISDAQGCTRNSDTLDVVVSPLPTAPTITPDGQLNFCDGEDVNLTASAAANYLWSTGETSQTITVNNSSTVSVVITDVNNCSASSAPVMINVFPIPPTPSITANGLELSSSSSNGNQWFLGGTPINGATAVTHIMTANGVYTVTVSENGCVSDFSAPYTLNDLSVDNLSDEISVIVFPNPASDVLNVSSDHQIQTIALYTMVGQCLFEVTDVNAPIVTENIKQGSYLLRVTTEVGSSLVKVIFQ